MTFSCVEGDRTVFAQVPPRGPAVKVTCTQGLPYGTVSLWSREFAVPLYRNPPDHHGLPVSVAKPNSLPHCFQCSQVGPELCCPMCERTLHKRCRSQGAAAQEVDICQPCESELNLRTAREEVMRD